MRKVLTGCPGNCGGSCPLLAYVEEGRIVRLSPEEWRDDDGRPQLRPCAIGLAQARRACHPDRILYPLKRVGERGEGLFRRILWDEALDELASEMERVRRCFGPEAVLGLTGSGNVKGQMRMGGMWGRRLFNAFGALATRAVISNQAALFAADHTLGLRLPPPGREGLRQSKLVIMWGFSPSGSVRGTNTSWYLAEARESGTRFIFVDPRFTNSAAALADQWIPIRPGTDTAMLVAMATVMIQERLCDDAFLARCTYGFERYRDYCLGTSDGVPKTPAWAETICGVPAETIAALAREYAATKPACLYPSDAPGRTAFGEQFHRACMALAAMSGNVGIPGGGVGCYFGQNVGSILGLARVGALDPVDKTVVGWRWSDAILQGKRGGYPSDIKMVVSVAVDSLNQYGGVNKGIRALKQLEYVAVVDQFLTPMARYADLVLPATTQFEEEDVQVSNWDEQVYMFHNGQAVEPPGEVRSDRAIMTGLAARLGLEAFAPGPAGELDRLLAGTPLSLEELRKQGVYWHAHEEAVPLQEFRCDPEAHPLPTPSGKVEIYSQTMAAMGRPDLLPALPTYISEWEGPQHPLSRHYPLLLVTCHSARRIHSTFPGPLLDELEPHTVWTNPRDAGERNIRDGQQVEIFNEAGSMIIQARVTERIMPGVVAIHQGEWVNLDPAGRDRGGSANTLCKDTISPAEAATTNAVLVQARRWEE